MGPLQRHRPEQTTLYRLVQQHAATFFAQAETEAGADLPQFVKDEFDAFLWCGILAPLEMHLVAWRYPGDAVWRFLIDANFNLSKLAIIAVRGHALA